MSAPTAASGPAPDSPTGPVAGETAPDFTLPDQHGESLTLSSLRGGKVILYFYPEADTPGCTTQACEFRDRLEVLADEGYTVIGVSRDPVEKSARFAEKYALPYRLLSDPDRAVHELYGAFGEKKLYGKVVTGVIRSTFVIDEAGVLTLALRNVKATGHVAMLRKRLGLAD